MRSCFAASIAFFSLAPLSFSQTGMSPAGEMILAAPLFLQDANVSSTITMVSVVSSPLTSKVVVFDSNGAQIGVSSVSLDPHSQRILKLSDLLQSWSSPSSAGSVKILQDPSAKGVSITARLSIAGTVHGTTVALEEDFQRMGAAKSGTFRAAAGAVMGSPMVAVWNLGATAQTVNIQCLAEMGSGGTSRIPVAAGQAAIAQACGGTGTIAPSSSQLLSPSTGASPNGAVGVSVSGSGGAGTLALYGFAFRKAGAASALRFDDTGAMRSGSSVFAGVPVGTSSALSGSPFQPSLALANFGSQPANVSVTYATAASPALSANPIAQAVIPPGTSKTIPLPALPGDPAMRNSFVVQSNAAPGTLLSGVTSVNAANPPQMISLAGRDQQREENGGAGEWSLANGDSSTLLLFNSSNAPGTFSVHVGAKGMMNGLWAKSYQLAAMETKSIDLRDLIANGETDVKGNRIPSNATEGEIAWFTPEIAAGTGRLMVSNPAMSMARNVDIEIYIVMCGLGVDPGSLSFDFEDSGDMTMLPQACTSYSSYACSGSPSGYGAASSYSWGSLNPSIASVSGASNEAAASFDGNYPGQTQAQAQAKTPNCTFPASGPVAVQLQATLHASATPTSVDLANGTATVSAYVSIAGAPAGFADEVSVTITFLDHLDPSTINLSSAQKYITPAMLISVPSNTPQKNFLVTTALTNETPGTVGVNVSGNAVDTKNPSGSTGTTPEPKIST